MTELDKYVMIKDKVEKVNAKDLRCLKPGEDHPGPWWYVYLRCEKIVALHPTNSLYWQLIIEFDPSDVSETIRPQLHNCNGASETRNCLYANYNQVFVRNIYEDGLDNWE